jgi:hypothetical protein
MSSPSLVLPWASDRYDGWLVDSIPPCSAKTVEAGRHNPSYLYMAAKPECVSLCIELFGSSDEKLTSSASICPT